MQHRTLPPKPTEPRSPRPGRRAVAGLAVVVSLVLSGGGLAGAAVASRTATPTTAAPAGDPAGGDVTLNSFALVPVVARAVRPSVVTIQTSDGLGSGVVWSADGLIVTDAHVVGTHTKVTVAFADGQQVDGTVQATDDVTDLAVVKADRTGLTAASFVTKVPQLGDLAVVIGSPLGFTNSVTAGVISGVNREIPGSAAQTQSLVGLIQTDAPVSPGNSGGAVVDGKGRVVGVVEAYIPPANGAVSLGFAIPSSTVVDTVRQLIDTGQAKHAYLGVATTEITPQIQQQLGLSQSSGAAILEVSAGSPAAAAGLRPGDVLVAAGDTKIATPEDLVAVLRDRRPGDELTIKYVRDGKTDTATATLTDRPAA